MAAQNPYVGPDAIPEDRPLCGRRHETADVRSLLATGRILLLYAPSGAGKTSLIQAGLLPALRKDERLRILFVKNFRGGRGAHGVKNRYLANVYEQLEAALPKALRARRPLPPTSDSLGAYLADLPGPADHSPEQAAVDVLVLDQFEEVFTLDPLDLEAKRAFLGELGAALKDRGRLALLSMREAHIAKLDQYLHLFPTGLKNRYRLGLLDYGSALKAITIDDTVEYEPGAAEALLESLWEVRTHAEESGAGEARERKAPREGAWVEPVLLQVACANLWEACRSSERITNADVAKPELSVEQAIAAYYARAAHAAAQEAKAAERDVRDWVDERLITPGGARGVALYDPVAGWGLTAPALQALEAAHLIRREAQSGRSHYELTNDRMISPIQRDNERWRARNLAPLQVKARNWQRASRPDRLLLSTSEWLRAFGWRRAHAEDLREEEADFWRASMRAFLVTRALPVLATLVVLAGALWGTHYQIELQQRSLRLEQQAILLKLDRAKELATERAVDRALALSAQAAAEVESLTKRRQADTIEFAARDTLLSVLRNVGDIQRIFIAEQEVFQAVAFHPAKVDPVVAYGGMEGKIHIADLRNPVATSSIDACLGRSQVHDQVASLAFDPQGRWLAAGCESGEVAVWSTDDWKERSRWRAHKGKVWALAANRDGRFLASGSNNDKTVKLVALRADGSKAPEARPADLDVEPVGYVWSLAFSPIVDTLVVGDGVAATWTCGIGRDGVPAKCIQRIRGEPDKPRGENDAVRAIAFSPEGSRIALGHWKGGVDVWDAALSSKSLKKIDVGQMPGPVHSMVFITLCDRPYLAIGRGVRVQYRPTPSDQVSAAPESGDCAERERRFSSVGDEAYALAFHPPSKALAAATRAGYVAILDVARGRDRITHEVPIGTGRSERLRAAIVEDTRSVSRLLVALQERGENAKGNLALVTVRNGILDSGPHPIISAGSDDVLRLSASPQMNRVATLDKGGSVSVWGFSFRGHSTDLVKIRSLGGSQFKGLSPSRVELSPDGKLLICAFRNSNQLLVVAPDRKDDEPNWVDTELARVREIAFSHDGRLFGAGGKVATPLPRGGTDGVLVWNVDAKGLSARSTKPMHLTRLANEISEIAFAADETGTPLVVAGGEYGQINVWDVGSGRLVRTLRAGSRPIWRIAYQREASLLAAADDHGVVRLWGTGQWEPTLLSPPSDAIQSPGFLAFGPDGTWLIAGTETVRIWDIDWRSLWRKACSIIRDPGQHGADSLAEWPKVCKGLS